MGPKVTASGYKVILIQAGTNDLADLVYKKGIEMATVQDVMKHYHTLNEMIYRRNKHAFLMFCSILPRKTYYDLFFPLIFGFSYGVQNQGAGIFLF